MGIQVWQLRDQRTAELSDDVELEAVAAEGSNLLVDEQPLPSEQVQAVDGVQKPETVLEKATITPPLNAQPEPVAPTVGQTVQTNPEFRLASIIFPGHGMVVTQVPTTSSADPLDAQQLKLLGNMLASVGINQLSKPEVTFFNWPMLRSPGFDQSEKAACQASQAFLNGQKSKYQVSFVLLMGEGAGRYLVPQVEGFEGARGQLISDASPPLLLTDDLEHVIAEPALKARVWRDLQPLRLIVDQT
ncbi:hypothetical protein imdm_849 [gamma proteobacterium IMCC2047]|nr:hypothetical protein imdm_849 [gamma proteobacterium IMCC2047]